MNISLTDELEAFVKTQVESGMYNSASEVIREALRLKIRGNMEHQLTRRLEQSRRQYADGNYRKADSSFFDEKLARLKKQQSA